jgi:hypothetical protein
MGGKNANIRRKEKAGNRSIFNQHKTYAEIAEIERIPY